MTSHDQYHTKLCYDVNGNDGDVLLIIRDEENSESRDGESIFLLLQVCQTSNYDAKRLNCIDLYINRKLLYFRT